MGTFFERGGDRVSLKTERKKLWKWSGVVAVVYPLSLPRVAMDKQAR